MKLTDQEKKDIVYHVKILQQHILGLASTCDLLQQMSNLLMKELEENTEKTKKNDEEPMFS